jgi:hypothetical protein
MWDLCKLIWWAFIGLFRLRIALVAENLALRQQINVLRRTAPKRPRFGSIDRLIFVSLFRGLDRRLRRVCARGQGSDTMG